MQSPIDSPALAIVGGGQLARMMEQAAVSLAVPVHLLAEGPDAFAGAAEGTQDSAGDSTSSETPLTWQAWVALAGARVRQGDLAGATRAYREAARRADSRAQSWTIAPAP